MLDAFVMPQPSVTALGQSAGPASGGTTLSIVGANFTGATEVKFGGVLAANFQIQSDGAISATSPPGPPGAVDVTVTTAAGTSPPVAGDQVHLHRRLRSPEAQGQEAESDPESAQKEGLQAREDQGREGEIGPREVAAPEGREGTARGHEGQRQGRPVRP